VQAGPILTQHGQIDVTALGDTQLTLIVHGTTAGRVLRWAGVHGDWDRARAPTPES